MLLQAQGLSKTFNIRSASPTEVLRSVDISCARGEFIAIMGPSGAGKSTLMHILASLDTPDSGSVVLVADNEEYRYAALSPSKLARIRNRYLGVVYQFHHLLPEFTALENVMMPLLISGVSTKLAEHEATTMIERVELKHRKDHLPSQLSGGEQQRIAIARAIVNKPHVVFADEPTGNLDTTNASSVAALLTDLQAEYGLACIVATHSNELASKAHRTIHLKDGCIQD